MSGKKPKTYNSLMKYMRDVKGISVAGAQKRKLRNMGYYHGYKGYRFINKPVNTVPYSTFEELSAIYDFDARLKTIFYPWVMKIETGIKNYVLEVVLAETSSENFVDIYTKLLDNYKMFSTTGKTYKDNNARAKAEDKFKKELKKRLDLRSRIYKIQADAFGNGNKIAQHFLSKDVSIPIWGIFELLSLGEFGHFVSCLNLSCRKDISQHLRIQQSDDTNAMMPQRLIYATKDLRNAIAHNDVIFDTRFSTGNIDNQVRNAISNATGVKGVTFETITDYLVLIVYQLKLLGITKTELRKLIADFVEAEERLRMVIPINVFNQIIHTDNNSKIAALKKYI